MSLIRSISLLLAVGTCLMMTCACANEDNQPAVVNGQSGQTIKELVDSLPATGGTVVLGFGSWRSGYGSGDLITKANVTIAGSGRPSFNTTFTALVGGTIILGVLPASTGADYFTVRNLGVDAGPAYINAYNAGVPTDALAIYNGGQVIGATRVESPIIDNVACLGYSPTAAEHCMLVENVNRAQIYNVMTAMNQHGLVLKGTNSTVNGVVARGHGIDSVLVKSDTYAPASQDSLSNITVEPLLMDGDTTGVFVLGLGAPVSGINIDHVQVISPLSWGINVQGASASTLATNLTFSNVSISYPGGSPTDEFCMQFAEDVSDVQISQLECTGMWAGVRAFLPDVNTFNNFTLGNSSFEDIATDAVVTFGTWNVSNVTFDLIGSNGIINPYGVTTVCGNTFDDIGGQTLLSAGGTFTIDSAGTCTLPNDEISRKAPRSRKP